MIESRDYVPKVYSESRDYQALLKLLDLVVCNIKSNIDNFISYINPEYCRSEYLPILASYVGYNYDNSLSYEINRLIINHYKELINNRGCETGIKLAAALAINAIKISAGDQNFSDLYTSLVDIGFDDDSGDITIYILTDNYSFKIFDLLETVRPAGVGIKIVKSDVINSYDKINIGESISSIKSQYSPSTRSAVESTDVGSGEVGTGE